MSRPESEVLDYLAHEEQKELLRFVFVGSVDDGKSTLIGRLLHDTESVFADQLEAVRKASAIAHGEIDFSLFTDGLRAEREQGITIDVAYRYFSTKKRKFILADTPGHVQYTRNMATGASTATVAIILVDARLGVLQQTKRHAFIASLLGIPHLAVAVNKMDLVDYKAEVFREVQQAFAQVAQKMRFEKVHYFPVSALKGDNVVQASASTPWYDGPTLLSFLESVPSDAGRNMSDFRFPVQIVLRPDLDYRGFAGQIASGRIAVGDEVLVLPSATPSRVRAIDGPQGALESAAAPLSVSLRLEDEVDVSRGDMIVRRDNRPQIGRRFEADMVWLAERPLDVQKAYILKHTTQSVRAQVHQVHFRLDPDDLDTREAPLLELNDIGRVTLHCHRALYYDDYTRNRSTGAFILIDSFTNQTVAAGMIRAAQAQDLDEALRELRAGSALEPKTLVSPLERRERMGQSGATVWLTGLPGSGRWSLAYALERRLFDLGRTAHVLDPTNEDLKTMTSAAKACTDAGLVTICAFPSPRQGDRNMARALIDPKRFVEVFVDTSEALCRERRPDANFEDFEAPRDPAVTIPLDRMRLDDAVALILEELERRGQFEG